jgi:hypothetical protein
MADLPNFAALLEPFPYASIGWRVGARTQNKEKGQALPYIDARDVQTRLDQAVGPQNWAVSFQAAPGGNGVLCTISIRSGDTWVAKQDAAQQDKERDADKDKDQALELAVKGANSNAFKRAGVMWGIGRYLYAYDPPWVALRDGKYLLETPKLPDHMLPENERGGTKALVSRVNPAAQANAEAGIATPVATIPAGGPKPLYDSSVAGEAVDPTADNAPKELFQSSVAGDMDDPSAPAKPAARTAQKTVDLPVIGTADQWSTLCSKDKETIRLLNERVQRKSGLNGVECFLKEGNGTALPEWVRKSLIQNIETISGATH